MGDEVGFRKRLETGLHHLHVEKSKQPIRLPSTQGEFPSTPLLGPPAVVPDANWLRNDIRYACRNRQRTVLVNAANSGVFRLFCAEHVINEVFEHSKEWTSDSTVSEGEFLQRWFSEYLPVIRVIPDEVDLASLLSPEETTRLEQLRSEDPDDVPSVALSLIVEAFFLSEDCAALRGVYGNDANRLRRVELLQTLKAGGDAGELGSLMTLVINVLLVAGGGITTAVKKTFDRMGGAIVPLIFAAMFLARRMSSEAKQRLKSAAASAAYFTLEFLSAYLEVQEHFQRAAPNVPSWKALSETNSPETVLARACMHTLARSRGTTLSAEQLARQLPILDVPQGVTKVREQLRTQEQFCEIRRGRWQLGQVAEFLARHLQKPASHPLPEETRHKAERGPIPGKDR